MIPGDHDLVAGAKSSRRRPNLLRMLVGGVGLGAGGVLTGNEDEKQQYEPSPYCDITHKPCQILLPSVFGPGHRPEHEEEGPLVQRGTDRRGAQAVCGPPRSSVILSLPMLLIRGLLRSVPSPGFESYHSAR